MSIRNDDLNKRVGNPILKCGYSVWGNTVLDRSRTGLFAVCYAIEHTCLN